MRKRQIDTLKIFNHNVQEVVENEEYLVNFDCGGREIAINILLGNGFPNEKPKLIVSPILKHPWVNATTGEIENAPGILNYTIHSDLGRVVQAVGREFEKHPPMFVNETSSTPQHHSHQQSSSMQQQCRNGNIHDFNAESRSAVPAQATHEQDPFGLQNLTTEELNQLNADEDYLEDFVEKLPFVQHQNDEMDQLMGRIESLVLDNLARKETVEEQKLKLESLALEFKELGQHWDSMSQQYQRKAEDFSPQHIKELLQIAVSTADAKSDDEAQRFLAGNSDVSTFLQNFIETRKLYTLRKAKEERLVEQLTALERAAF
ncbi:vacuolar protein sorting-associated protein 37A [Anopheles ziemanni]|uniref:vacuolar protein sorting-associated protein 37A n=1 Tax=Anopheles coustani TaxID=139045 RepID=UPI00265A021F|nr:vacuolar protein sorting-associated protein 37A [Anopheles coustani]XP_058172482.1 vacuolar protein sorting-associated protein 37A [Anopheles ziemanni]